MEHASRLADAGDVAGGRRVLLASHKDIMSSISHETPLSRNLASDMQECALNFESADQYRSVGSKFTKMRARGHTMQRSDYGNASMYKSAASRKANLKASWGMSLSGVASGSDSD